MSRDESSNQLQFGWDEEQPEAGDVRAPSARALAPRLAVLAAQGIYLGTSSWKYPGWIGQVYEGARYQTRGRFSQKKFGDQCLAEYASIFPTVCGDFAFYQFPTEEAWRGIFAQLPAGYRFSLKVPEAVTVECFPQLPRYGARAGTVNPDFMNARLVMEKFLGPLEQHRDKLGAIIFEFGTFHDGPYADGARFAQKLDEMLSMLPTKKFAVAVEVRNKAFLEPACGYFAALKANHVAHCFNSWSRMPAIGEQLQVEEAWTAGHVAARLLLRPGRSYEQAVKTFAPYDTVKDVYAQGRAALRELIERCRKDRRILTAFVNNRFEGNAIGTIESVLDA